MNDVVGASSLQMPRLSTPNDLPPKRRRAVLIAILAVALALVVTCAVALLRSSHQLHQSIARVHELGKARAHLEALQRLVLQAESDQRGYLLTGGESHIAFTGDSSRRADEHLDAMEGSVQNDAQTRAAFAELREASTTMLANVNAILDLASRGGRAASILASGRGAEGADRFHRVATDLDARLAREESTIQERLVREAQFRSGLILVLLAANVVLVTAVAALAWQFVRIRSVAQIVSLSPTIEHEGEWITFEAYLDRRFGVKTSRGVTSKEVARLGWVRPPSRASSGVRSQPPCRQSRRSP